LNDEGEEVEGMNIPMSVGAPHYDVDKAGVKCRVYDIIANPTVLTECLADKTGQYRDFVCQLAIQSIEHKYKDNVDQRYKLPKLKYLGKNVLAQYIQDRKKMPKIEEIRSSPDASLDRNKVKATQRKAMEAVEKDLKISLQYLLVPELSTSSPVVATSATEILQLVEGGALEQEPIPGTSCSEYIEPLAVPSSRSVALFISAELENLSEETAFSAIIQISPFRAQIKIQGYKKLLVYFPTAVLPEKSAYTFSRPYEGVVSKVELQVAALLDQNEWEASADYGSKVWLVTQALRGDSDEVEGDGGASEIMGYNPYSSRRTEESRPDVVHERKVVRRGGEETMAEDRFHLNLPDDVDQYTGVMIEGNVKEPSEDWELPEDRFHKKDAASSFLINQREQAKKDKWTNFEK
jgi:hypothetical protein